jgi:5-formyltetrahydrofolate cyclo-ligase
VSDFCAFPAEPGLSVAQTKRDLRRELLAARRAKSGKKRENQDALVRATLLDWLTAIDPATVAAYVPMTGEPGGADLPEALARAAVTVLLPVVQADRDLDWVAYLGPSSLAPAALGLTEPVGPGLGVDAVAGADVVIVPALAVDRSGMRLGRGGGSYDRALARVRGGTRVVALLYPGELMAAVPTEPHDRPVHAVVIGGEVISLSPRHGSGPAGR